MKTAVTIFIIVALGVVAGCQESASQPANLGKGGELLSVDFKEGQTLRYKFVSSREMEMDWSPPQNGPPGQKGSKVDKSSESLEIVVAYTPVEVDPYGLTTIEAKCESARVSHNPPRRRGQKADAAASFAGKTFAFTVGPTGKIEDYSQMDRVIKNVGLKAFRADTRKGKIKDPDIIGDFTATQWFLWDSISSIDIRTMTKGLKPGQSWKSKLSVPLPMVFQQARDVTYTLEEIRRSEAGEFAVIRSSYSPSESTPKTWPIPYPDGSFQVSGRFGFLRGYKVLGLQGDGEEFFNIKEGRTESYEQQYRIEIEASFPIGIEANPRIYIEQKITMQLIE